VVVVWLWWSWVGGRRWIARARGLPASRGGYGWTTHIMCWEESKCKYTKQTGLAASTVADDDEFPADDILGHG
jgi:hypothetical protein